MRPHGGGPFELRDRPRRSCSPGLSSPRPRADARRGPPPSRLVSFSAPSLFPSFSPAFTITSSAATTGRSRVRATPPGAGRWRSVTGAFARGDFSRRAARRRAGLHRITVRQERAARTLSLPRALPAERLPHLHVHPLGTGVAAVLLGGPLLPLRRASRSSSTTTGCRLVGQRAGPGHQRAAGRDHPLVRPRLQAAASPPPERQPGPHLQRRRHPADIHDLQLLANGDS